jgi:23S rRNA (cytidine1920-2'-O)/16S rRNA (cytidine1409-2'-O)-methyltransferase
MNATRRRLDAELVRRRLVPSRSAARDAITAGRVEIEGVVSPKPSTLVAAEATVRMVGDGPRFVGRGGLKLEAALDGFGIDVAGRTALDVGASTGGFTDCLLQRGAARVVALDVGYGQLDWALQSDPRVTAVDRTNYRHADLGALGAPFDVVVVDVSFISLGTVSEQLRASGGEATDYVALVKPQFEVGKGDVGKGGIVRDPGLHFAALVAVVDQLAANGLGARGVLPSPITGAKGNREFLLWCRVAAGTVTTGDLEQVTRA